MNIFTRFIKSITDFNSSNIFIKEKMSKSIIFLIVSYLTFALVMASATYVLVKPTLNQVADQIEVVLEDMGSFTIENGGIQNYQGVMSKSYQVDGLDIVIDMANHYNTETASMTAFVIQKDQIISGNQVIMDFKTLQAPLLSDDVLLVVDQIPTIFNFFIGVFVALGFIGVFIASGLVWGLMIIMNGFVKKDISSADLYKVAIHSMVVPGIFILMVWLFNISTSINSLIYFAIAGFYGFQFMKRYEDEVSLENLYE